MSEHLPCSLIIGNLTLTLWRNLASMLYPEDIASSKQEIFIFCSTFIVIITVFESSLSSSMEPFKFLIVKMMLFFM